ncbi:MAG TPA: nicotinate (nicotinamide) nucleotide adenylyltransferase [Bacteroidaceae bacterium]|nr:nicotinate (nicotinamide) nucleotide adenylyltransferase [Bacteroidaceae bacterium]
MATSKRVGIYGGSFSPIHLAHTILAQYLIDHGYVDEVWLMVSPQNPLKSTHFLYPESLRIEMAQMATAHLPKVKVSDFECHLPKPTYTVFTMDALCTEYPEVEFTLLVGGDNWRLFDRWREGERLLSLCKLLVYPRPGFLLSDEEIAALPSSVTYLADAPLMNMSSTEIRQAIEAGESCQDTLHPDVEKRLHEYMS